MSGARLRITAGLFRGRPVQVPPGARPTESRVREALFSIWHDGLEGCSFLDLFAGSGAVGLEALSRGADRVVFVESNRRAARTLHRNLEHFELSPGAYRLRCQPAAEAVAEMAAGEKRFDRIFADPPYSWSLPPGFLGEVVDLLAPGGHFGLERPAGSAPPAEAPGIVRIEQRRYGGSVLLFYARG
ncbi:MAG: 16S rRNA (guanine(966)-N(2))-methyltransferase RsmD [Acidobacteria bacterium]|nr:16S rRNA (guanine(966)-N(2))-methyltransferase RsmD [Acidobacteriota bacterium]